MPEKLENCVKAVREEGQSESSAWAICQARMKDGACPARADGLACKMQVTDSYQGSFTDAMPYDPRTKTALSVRDGVLEYLGQELGLTPADKVFRIYRSPATIANVAPATVGIPVTNDHVALDMAPPTDGGRVTEARMVDLPDDTTASRVAIQNKFALSDTMTMAVDGGKHELSLGYQARLVPHDEYDFEQRDILPHHVAVVDRGRCGPACSFLDRLPREENMSKPKLPAPFLDAEGVPNLQQIMELSAAWPEAIKLVPVNELPKLLPVLQKIVEAAKGVMPEEEPAPAGEPAPAEEPAPIEDEEDPEMKKKEEEKEFADAVSAAVKAQTQAYATTVAKARDFLPDDYAFADKSTVQIMQDTLATSTTEKFTDAEIPLAFKLLRKTESRYTDFGDANIDPFIAIGDKEL